MNEYLLCAVHGLGGGYSVKAHHSSPVPALSAPLCLALMNSEATREAHHSATLLMRTSLASTNCFPHARAPRSQDHPQPAPERPSSRCMHAWKTRSCSARRLEPQVPGWSRRRTALQHKTLLPRILPPPSTSWWQCVMAPWRLSPPSVSMSFFLRSVPQ